MEIKWTWFSLGCDSLDFSGAQFPHAWYFGDNRTYLTKLMCADLLRYCDKYLVLYKCK